MARIGGGAPLIMTLVVVNVLVHLTLEYIGSTDSELRTQLYGYFGLLPPPYFGFTQIVRLPEIVVGLTKVVVEVISLSSRRREYVRVT